MDKYAATNGCMADESREFSSYSLRALDWEGGDVTYDYDVCGSGSMVVSAILTVVCRPFRRLLISTHLA